MDFYGMTLAELRAWAESLGLPPFRGQQVFEALYRAAPEKFADISVLSKELAERLDKEFTLTPASEAKRQDSADGTVKSLLALPGGKLVECVSIPTTDRHT